MEEDKLNLARTETLEYKNVDSFSLDFKTKFLWAGFWPGATENIRGGNQLFNNFSGQNSVSTKVADTTVQWKNLYK